jgi:anti-anti-sigma factor
MARAHPRGIEERHMRVVTQPGRVTLAGDVDISNIDLMATALDQAVPVHGRLVVDLAAVSFIDVSGVSRLVELARRLGGAERLAIVDPPRQLRRILDAADWESELELVPGGAR